MIELLLDLFTNKIYGYNEIVDPDTLQDRDKVFVSVEDIDMPLLKTLNNLYYIDGKIVQKNTIEKEESDEEYITVLTEYQRAKQNVDDEHKIFMDHIVDGMSLEDARQITKDNRDKLTEITDKMKIAEQNHQKREEEKIIKKFEEEESKIRYSYFLSMLTIVRDENDYIEEWIRYHIENIGFDHFYIYDNESVIPVKDYLESVNFQYLDRITFIDWETSESSQHDSHMNFLRNYASETRWVFTADPDEYIVIKDGSKTLKEFLGENNQYSAIECIWHHFNANGQEKKTEGTDMERFPVEVDWHYGKDRGKRFAQTNRINGFINYNATTRFNTTIAGATVGDSLWEKSDQYFQLNHYYTRSYEEWLKKMARGTVVPYCNRKYSEFFQLNPDMKHLDIGEDYMQLYGTPSHISKNIEG